MGLRFPWVSWCWRKPAEAKVQFARAAQRDLTPSEKAELTKWAAGHV